MSAENNDLDQIYQVRLPGHLRDEFLELAHANDMDGAKLVRAFMRNYVEQNKKDSRHG